MTDHETIYRGAPLSHWCRVSQISSKVTTGPDGRAKCPRCGRLVKVRRVRISPGDYVRELYDHKKPRH